MNSGSTQLRIWCVGLAVTGLAVVISYFWIDRPVANFVHAQIADKSIFIWMQRFPEALPCFSAVILVWAGVWVLLGRALSRCQSVLLLCALSYVTSAAVNNQLKFAFGRMWPETWVNNNPSLIHDGAYGFAPFHGGPGFASFPSGHATAICSVMAALWLCLPRWRAVYAVCVAAVVIGLLGADYHFVSDILAGAFVGWSAGWTTVTIWRGRNHAALSQ